MADSDQIKVVIRVRPLIQREHQNGLDARWSVQEEKTISQVDFPSLSPYTFDQVYDRDCSTWELYSGVIAPIVDAAMNGYHGTVFAYGQSGSGKTYTMSGDRMTPGVISQSMNDIFAFIQQKPSHEFLMRASYMEIYNEKIFDLLSSNEKHMKIHETTDHQINVVGLEEELVSSCEQVLSVIQKGDAKRKFAETKQNDRSSRSHCIFRIIIESRKQNEADAAVMVSHLNFVDLAGSEKAADNSGDRFREGCSINMSLFCLSNVISKLSEGVGNQFIGFRDSKLTRILQNALGGNSKTVIVATINPTTIEESHSTLRFAMRAKTIKNKPHVNEVLSEAAMLKKYRNQITDLEKLVKDMGVADIQSANEDLKKKLEEKQELIKQLTKQIVSSSSLTDQSTGPKKSKRRETWCAPKVHRRSYFPSLPFVEHQRGSALLEVDEELSAVCKENLDIPFTSISVSNSNDEGKTKAFLRRSEEMALSNSLLSGLEDQESPRGKDMAWEIQRLEEAIKQMEEQHTGELEKLRDRIREMEFEKAVAAEHQEEQDQNMVTGQEEARTLTDKLTQLEYDHQLQVEENQYLQKNLWHAEEEIKRLKDETCHLCNKRFDLSLDEWQQLETAKTSLEAEMKQLVANLHDKDKEIEDLKRALGGQEPYIARLEQQLEMYMGAGNGQLGGGGGKRRSGIPVLVKSDDVNSPKSVKDEDNRSLVSDSLVGSRPASVDRATSTEDLPQSPPAATSFMEEAVLASTASLSMCEPSPLPFSDASNMTMDSEPGKLLDRSVRREKSVSFLLGDTISDHDLSQVSSSSKVESISAPYAADTEISQANEAVTPERDVFGVSLSYTESSTKRATCLKRRSDITLMSPNEVSSEMSERLMEREREVEQLSNDKTKLLESLNQANAEIVRFKEAMEAMEQADAERMEELAEVSKLRGLLNRRDLEVQRLESANDRLKEELQQQALNSSVSSLTSSFTEPRRKSAMLREREAEIWKLKDQLIQQARHLDDIQQEKDNLEGIVVELQTKPVTNEEETTPDKQERSLSSSSTSSSVPSSGSEGNTSVSLEEDVGEPEPVTVTAAELEAVQRMLSNKNSLIEHLKNQLQEKEDEMEQMFEGQMLVSTDMIQTHLQQAEDQKEQIQDLTDQLKSKEEEIIKLRAKAEVQKSSTSSSGSSQGEESAFLEQLIMDKMTLEESVQEKIQELTQALEQCKELQIQLDERRALVNELRQKNEDTTETLLSTQEELIHLKRIMEDQQTKDTSSHPTTGSGQSCTKPTTSKEQSETVETKEQSESIETKEQSEPVETKEQSESVETNEQSETVETKECLDSLAAEGLEHVSAEETDSSFEISFKTQNIGETEKTFSEKSADTRSNDVSFEVSFKTVDAEVKNCDNLNNTASTADNSQTNLSEPVEEQVSCEVSFKSRDTDVAAASDFDYSQRIQSLEQREQELLEMVKERELQIQSLVVLQEQHLASPQSDRDQQSQEVADTVTESSDELEKVSEEKRLLEERLQATLGVIEEKTNLETKIQELLKVVDEKSAIISKLQRQSEQSGNMSSQSAQEQWVEEKETLLSKLNHLSQVEECLEKNINLLEQTQEEKAALGARVQDLEAKLEELTMVEKKANNSSESALQLEKEALDKQMTDMSKTIDDLQSELAAQNNLSTERRALLQEKDILEMKLKEKGFELEHLESKLEEVKQENECITSKKSELEKELEVVKSKETRLLAQIEEAEQVKIQLSEASEQRTLHETKAQELTARVDELTNNLEHMTTEYEELTTEVTWQTKENEKLQGRIEELETELEEQKQEAEELVQEWEKEQKLQKDSEHCQRVVEETLKEIQKQNEQLELDKQTLATERDEFELKEEAAVKEQERLRSELRVSTENLQSRISSLELELQTVSQQKEVLEAALADKESAHSMGELLHEKLSVDLQESQSQVSTMKSTLSQLQSALQNQEAKFNTLNKITASLETERDQLAHDKSSLEKEKLDLCAQLRSSEDEILALRRDLDSKQAVEEKKQDLEDKVSRSLSDMEGLRNRISELTQQVSAGRDRVLEVQQEKDQVRASNKELTEKLALTQSHCAKFETQCQELTNMVQQMKTAGEERVASLQSECCRLQDELGTKLEHIETLQKELQAAKASDSCPDGDKMVPLLEVKKQKFSLKTKIVHLMRELESLKEAVGLKDWWIQELQTKLSKYENEEQENKDEKIETLEEKIKELETDLKTKDLQLAGLNMQQQETITKITRQLANAEDTVTYKDQIIGKLKGEIRRIRSEELSFCATAAPKTRVSAPEPVKSSEDERIISSHSGIIDRYTVTLLESHKHKLQQELKKTQDRLKCRESELHWAKVALAKAKTSNPASPSPPAIEKPLSSPVKRESREERKYAPHRDSSMLTSPGSSVHSTEPIREQRVASRQRSGTCVDGAPTASQPVPAMESLPRPAGSAVCRGAGDSVSRTGVDPLSRSTWKQGDTSLVSAGGTSVDLKKDRPVLPSAVDKENTPCGTDVLAAHKTSLASDLTKGDSPINIEPEFWKKPKPSAYTLYKSSSKGKSVAGADQCKTQ